MMLIKMQVPTLKMEPVGVPVWMPALPLMHKLELKPMLLWVPTLKLVRARVRVRVPALLLRLAKTLVWAPTLPLTLKLGPLKVLELPKMLAWALPQTLRLRLLLEPNSTRLQA